MRRVRGLRKDRKTWARVEHRIDDDILEFCDLDKTSGLDAVASPPGVMQKLIDGSAATTPRAEQRSDSYTPPLDLDGMAIVAESDLLTQACFELEEELDQPLDFDSTATLDLPPLEEALDFLISIMEE
ncbi:unnamed protein product [Phytophthora lilii]|uniref:Unnamed protein product n=1 Tax=Phytophthora lilii TaxID=2077276 RepID=A0A9W6WRV2_9STRA|nr:unnamed protein product [Phytophthora lilii]